MSRLLIAAESTPSLSNGIEFMRKTMKRRNRRVASENRSTLVDWQRVSHDHVRKACEMFDSGSAAPGRHVQSLILMVDGRRYPAKFIQALAYCLATGRERDVQRARCRDANTMKFYDRLGMTTHRGPSQLVSPNGGRRNSA